MIQARGQEGKCVEIQIRHGCSFTDPKGGEDGEEWALGNRRRANKHFSGTTLRQGKKRGQRYGIWVSA